MDDDGFEMVKPKKRKGKAKLTRLSNAGHENPAHAHSQQSIAFTSTDVDEMAARIEIYRREIEQSDFYRRFCTILAEACQNMNVEEIVCYGLGRFTDCVTSRYQMALLLNMAVAINGAHVCAFDPVFSALELRLLQRFNIKVIAHNEEGKRRADKVTIFYMPHCAKALCNNLLWANWRSENLQNLVLVSNSFSHMLDMAQQSYLNRCGSFIIRASEIACEFGVENCFRFNDIFNNTSIHVFPMNRMLLLKPEFWESENEPKYCADDEIITRDMMLQQP